MKEDDPTLPPPTPTADVPPPPPHVPADLAPAAAISAESHPDPHGTVLLPPQTAAPPAAPVDYFPAPTFAILQRQLVIFGVLIALAMLLISAGFYAYYLDTFYNIHRQRCLVAMIVAGAAATLCLAGAMHTLNKLVDFRWRWYWRWLMLFAIRLLLVAELGTTAVALGCSGLLLFHTDLPASSTGTYSPPPTPLGDPAPTFSAPRPVPFHPDIPATVPEPPPAAF